jgi:hypothetical protein
VVFSGWKDAFQVTGSSGVLLLLAWRDALSAREQGYIYLCVLMYIVRSAAGPLAVCRVCGPVGVEVFMHYCSIIACTLGCLGLVA